MEEEIGEEKIRKAEPGAKKAWSLIMSWIGGISALIGLAASIGGGVTWYTGRHKRQAEHRSEMALAEAQAKQGEYQASIQSYAEMLKSEPLDSPTLDQQLNTTMRWVEDFRVPSREGQNSADLAAPELDQILAILDSGLTRTTGTQAADVQAHIGWAHWLNQKIAQREFGHVAEQDLRAALVTDPSNVYANAMLGNWMLQNGASFTEAVQHFNTAVAAGNARPYVRQLQLGGLVYLDKPGARAELVKAANDMRKSTEPLNEGDKKRILGFCFDPMVTDHGELAESLTAVAPDDAWKTYLWLDDNADGEQAHELVHDFISANLLELTGKRQESLEAFRVLQQKLKSQGGSMKTPVDDAVARLSHR